MTHRQHEMPFGTQIDADGSVRFRLWAPAARQVQLVLSDESRDLPMQSLAEGWFELVTREAQAGSQYKYRIDGSLEVPDPASRWNPQDVHGPSRVVDPHSFEWADASWQGRPWHTAVVYELHVGTFSPEGTFAGVEKRLEHLKELGVTVIELMPVADFPGKRGWGYDGVLPYAPDSSYGTPEDLKRLVVAAHRHGIAMMLDVVYNHFGPEGNYLHAYAPQFFTDRRHTPWGAAINFDGTHSRIVRDFFIHNALYWLEEYHFDGLRFDAVHAIHDDSTPHFLTELASTLRAGPGRHKQIHLVLENGKNESRFLGPSDASTTFSAQWNDDVHHCFHVTLTGERDGYYEDYEDASHAMLCRCLAQGFGYQGDASRHRGGAPRGEPSDHLPPTAFVAFLQNHDQIGNRALGERLIRLTSNEEALRAATAILLLAPSPPLLFMGEEWGATEPFPYFCDLDAELTEKVREGRRHEFQRFERFRDEAVWKTVPDPADSQTFRAACLKWEHLGRPEHTRWHEYYRRLLAKRHRDIVPLIPNIRSGRCIRLENHGAFAVDWWVHDGSMLHLLANLTQHTVPVVGRTAGRVIFATHPAIRDAVAKNELAPWSVTWLLERSRAHH